MKSENDSQVTHVAMGVLVALGGAHLLNDLLQAVLTASYPILKDDLHLSFSEIGLVTLIYQLAASVFQPVVGLVFDKRPCAYSLPLATTFTMAGLIGLATPQTFIGYYARYLL